MTTSTGSIGSTGSARTRPATVRALSVLLLVETAIAVILAGLAVIAAAITWLNRTSGDWSDLALAVLLVVAAGAGVVGAIDLTAWLALRARRRTPATALSLLAHLLPPLALTWLGARDVSGRIVTLVAAAALAVLGTALTVAPSTRAWLAVPRR